MRQKGATYLRPETRSYAPRRPMATRPGNGLIWLLVLVFVAGWAVTLV